MSSHAALIRIVDALVLFLHQDADEDALIDALEEVVKAGLISPLTLIGLGRHVP